MLLAEAGGERVKNVLASAAMSTVNLSEVAGHYTRNGVDDAAIRRVLDPLPFDQYPFDAELAYQAAQLLQVTMVAGLSFGDRACLALARQLGCPAMTADRAWNIIADRAGVEVEVIR